MKWPFDVEVEHVTSHARRKMQATEVRRGRVLVHWPSTGVVRFELATGRGIPSEAPSWFITAESLGRLRVARAGL